MARTRFVTPEVVRLTLSDGDWVDVKKELTAGEERRVFTDLVKVMHAGERAELQPDRVGKTQMLAYIVGWSFKGADDKPVSFSESALDSLDSDSYTELFEAIDKHIEDVDRARTLRKNGQDTSRASLATSA